MSQNDDPFADARDEVNRMGFGSLGGEGVDHHNDVKTKVINEGVICKLRCDRCGTLCGVTIPWTELIVMSQSMLPPNNSWKHDAHNGVFMPNSQCPHCQDFIRLGVTPDECARNLKAGVAGGKISGQQIQGFLQQMQPRRP